MAGKLGKYQMTPSFDTWSPKITKVNHLGQLFGLEPQKANSMMVNLLAFNYGRTLDTLLSKYPTKQFDDDTEYYWDVVGSARKNIPLVEARASMNGNAITKNDAMVGANKAPFYLVFNEPWFYDGEVIVGNYNEIYPMRVLGDPVEEGANYVYKVEIFGTNTTGIPDERLLAGEKFSTEYAPVERGLSRKVGGIHHATPSTMRNEWSQIRITHKVAGDMLNKKIAAGIPIVRDGKKVVETMWMHNVEWELERTFNDYKNNVMAFGTSNRNSNGEYMDFGKSGEVIRTGAGLFEQMEVANTHYYSTFDISLIEEILYGLSAGKLGFGERTFILKTGEMGAIQFHKAVTREISGWTVFQLNGDNLGVVKKTNAAFSGPTQALAAGFQFVEYYAPNGVHVKLDVDPFYDDPVRNKIQINGKPAMSYRYDLFDMGTMDQPNIFKCQIKGNPDYRGYQWGLRNPFTGQMGNPYMSYDEDSATFHRMATLGICILDPTRTMSLIPNVLIG